MLACMNHLAHALLACDQDPAAALDAAVDSAATGLLVGALLGDYARGRTENLEYPEPVITGIRVHRRIDRVSDSHPVVLELKQSFPAEWRRFAGIILDMHFDHILVRQWSQWCDLPLAHFNQRLFDIWENSPHLPPRALTFISWARSARLFGTYDQREVIENSLVGIARRLRGPNPLARSGEFMWTLDDRVADAFPTLLKDLQGVVRSITTGS